MNDMDNIDIKKTRVARRRQQLTRNQDKTEDICKIIDDKDEEEFYGIFVAEGCPSCEDLMESLNGKVDKDKVIFLDITKDESASELYQLVGADEKGTPSFVAMTKRRVCLIDENTFEDLKCIEFADQDNED